MKNIMFFLFILLLTSCYTNSSDASINDAEQDTWVLSGFVKKDNLNPILQPSDTLSFICPISGREIKWEERNVLNPSAIVKNDKVYLFYRAQDEKGTSRIGLAVGESNGSASNQQKTLMYKA